MNSSSGCQILVTLDCFVAILRGAFCKGGEFLPLIHYQASQN